MIILIRDLQKLPQISINAQRDEFINFSTFQLSNSADMYRITVGGYSGNATDNLNSTALSAASNGNRFSTIDRDYDAVANLHCATQSGGGWWHNGCSYARLNGNYTGTTWYGILWVINGRFMQPRFTEMKIQKRN